MISLKEWRYSKAYRFVSLLVLLNFLTSQNIYAQEYHVQEGIHLYTPVLEIEGERLEEKGTGSEILPSTTTALLPVPFSENPLSSPAPEIGQVESDDYEYETYSFDQVLDLIRPEFAVAIPVESVSTEELEILRRQEVEIAFVAVHGMKFLITSGNTHEIKTHSIIRELLREASFFAHTHPEGTHAEGPSGLDLFAAGARKEYLLNEDGILSFNGDGVLETGITDGEFLSAWDDATRDDMPSETEARDWANRFIAEMDRINHEAGQLELDALRAAGTVAPDPTLTATNLTNFSGSPWTLLMAGSSPNTSVVQQSNTQFQVNYDVAAAGSKSGAYVSFDNPTTSAVEVRNLSTLTDLIVGVGGPSGAKVRFTVEDSLGASSEVTLVDLSTATQYYKISKTLLPGIDWTKVKKFTYSIDSTLTSVLTGTLTIETKTLLYNSSVATNLPNAPALTLAPGSSAKTALVTSGTTWFKLNYDLSTAGSVSGASIVLDNPATTAVETGNLSTLNEFTFGFSGPSVSVKIEMEDTAGVKSSVVVSGINGVMQYFTVQKSQFTGGSLNWSQIKRINVYAQAGTGVPLTGTLVAHARTLSYSTALLTNLPNSPYLAITPGSSANTNLIEVSSSWFRVNYDVSQPGSTSGGSIVLDNPSTTTVETANLSANTDFTFALYGPSGGKVKLEFQDNAGNKSSVILAGLSGAAQYYTVSKGIFTGLDWTKIKQVNFIVDPTLMSTPTGQFTVWAKTLNFTTALVSNFPNSPSLAILPGSSGATNLIETGSSQFKFNYDVSQAGSFSGASIVLDNPATTAIEVGNLSSFSQFTFGIWGPSTGTGGKIKLEFEDSLGAKSSTLLTGLTPVIQYYTVSKGVFTGLDWTKIKRINFILDSTLISPTIGGVGIQAKTLNFTTALLTNFTGNPAVERMPGSTASTVVRVASTASIGIDFSLSGAGTKSGAVVNFDNPSTSGVETRNLSALSQFVFSAAGIANGKLRVEMEDLVGAKASTILAGLSTSTQYFVLSKALFSSIDLTKVKRVTFSIDPTLTSLTTGTLTIGARTLLYSTAVASQLPGNPPPVVLEGSNGATYLTQTAASQIKLNLDVTPVGSFSGMGFSFDDLMTTAVETRDLSQGDILTLGLQPGSSTIKKVRLEVEDSLGAKASLLINLVTGNQYYLIQKSLLTGIDWTKVKRMNFVVDRTYVTSSTGYKSFLQVTANGFPFIRTVIPSTTLTSANISTLAGTPSLFLLPGSSSPTALTQGTNQFTLSYDLTAAGTFSGARINYDKPSTTAVETVNLSLTSNIVFGVSSSANTVRVTMVDNLGKKSSALLANVAATEKYFQVNLSSFTGIDKTKITEIRFEEEPVVAANAPKTGTLTVSIKGLVPVSLLAPTVNAVTTPTALATQMLSGTKGTGTGIAINGNIVVAPSDLATWQVEVSLDAEGENIFNVQETTGAGEFGPAVEIKIVRETVVAKTLYLLSAPYTDQAQYTLKYRLGSVTREETVTLASGENVFNRSMTASDGSTVPATFKIYLVPTLRQSERMTYDANGNLISRTDSQGKVVSYSYNTLDQLASVTGIQSAPVSFLYDKNGNLAQMTDSRGTTAYTYDNLNQLTRVTFPDTKTLSYAYDLSGNMTQLTYPDGTGVSYTYDVNNRLTQVAQGTEITTYQYNAAGDLTQEVLPNGVKSSYGYDTDGRLISLLHTQSGGALIQGFTYTLDANGNRTQVVESLPGGINKTTQYAYDSLNRLQKVQYPDGRITTYSYDFGGNRKTMLEQTGAADPGTLTTYTYGIENRLEKLSRAPAATPASILSEEFFYYDSRGNLASRVYPEKTVLYSYDMRNLLMRVDDGTTVTEFVYDGQGNRVAKMVNGVRTNYIVDTSGELSQVLQEWDGSGAVAKSYTLGLDRISVKTPAAGSSRYFMSDALGSTTKLTDAFAAVTDSFSYDAFGNWVGTAPNHFLFTGEQFDPETGLVYLRARYYDPTTGRFLSKDPVLGLQTNTQTFNSYPYALNNPVNFTDREGKFVDIAADRGAVSDNLRGKPFDTPTVSSEDYMKVALISGGVLAAAGVAYLAGPSVISGVGAAASTVSNAFYSAATACSSSSLCLAAMTNPGPAIGAVSGAISGLQIGAEIASNRNLGATDTFLSVISGTALGGGIGFFRGAPPGGTGGATRRAFDLLYDAGDRISRSNLGFLPPGGGGGGGFGTSGFMGLGGNFFSSSRGGVLINKSASLLGENLSQITGATIDPVTGQLVLLGTNNTSVPDIRMDDLAAALKAVFSSYLEDPGVTIDPQYDASGNMLDEQLVRHFGDIENTDLGWVVFEADRVMKTLAAGKDNITGEPVTSSVPGYVSMLDRWLASGSGTGNSRFWFVPEIMELTRTADGKSFVFSNAKVQVLTEDMLIGGGATEPEAAAFAQHLTDNYSLYAQEFPIFERLRQVMKAVALARFIRDNNIPIDFSWLEDYQAPVVNTPNTTPTVRNSKTVPISGGTRTITVEGGVEIGRPNAYFADTGSVASLANLARSSRSSVLTQNWQVDASTHAVALSLMPQQLAGNFATVYQDIAVPTSGDLQLSLNRFYDSFEGQKSPFGFNWRLDPLIAKFEKPAIVNSNSLNGAREGMVRVFDRAAGRELNFKSSLVVTKTSTGISYTGLNANGTTNFTANGDTDGSTFIMNADKTYLFKRPDGSTVLFDTNGKILKETDRFGKTLTYAYSGGRLTSITDSLARAIQLTYDGNGRITRADGPLGLSVSYQYNTAGDLVSVKDLRTTLITTYAYDAQHNLTGSTDPFGFSSFGNQFDILGMAGSQSDERGNAYSRVYDQTARRETVTNAALGKDLVREYDSLQRVVRETDYLGQVTTYTYTGNVRLPASVTDHRNHKVNFTYNSKGNVLKVIDNSNLNAFGATLEFAYDTKGNVTWMRDTMSVVRTFVYDTASNLKEIRETLSTTQTKITRFTYDVAGNLTSTTDANNRPESFTYDSLGNLIDIKDGFGNTAEHRSYDSLFRLTGVSDGLSRGTNFSYDTLDQLTQIQTVFGTVHYSYTNGKLTGFLDARSNPTSFTYDPTTGDLLQVIDSAGNISRYTYDLFGRLDSVTDPNGQVTVFNYDDLGRLVYVGTDYVMPTVVDREVIRNADGTADIFITANERIVEKTFFFREPGQPSFTSVPVAALAPDRFSVHLAGLLPGKDYEYEIRLVDRGRNETRSATFALETRPAVATVNQPVNLRALSSEFNLTADEALYRAVLNVKNNTNGSTRQIVYNKLNAASLRGDIAGLTASTAYEYFWEMTDLSGNKTLTGKISFTTQAADDSFFILNQVTGTSVTGKTVNVRLKLALRSEIGSTFSYRKKGETKWTSSLILSNVLDGTTTVLTSALSPNTDYEYKVSILYYTYMTINGQQIKIFNFKTSQIQPFKTGSI